MKQVVEGFGHGYVSFELWGNKWRKAATRQVPLRSVPTNEFRALSCVLSCEARRALVAKSFLRRDCLFFAEGLPLREQRDRAVVYAGGNDTMLTRAVFTTCEQCLRHRSLTLGAAVAYYSVFSMGPYCSSSLRSPALFWVGLRLAIALPSI